MRGAAARPSPQPLSPPVAPAQKRDPDFRTSEILEQARVYTLAVREFPDDHLCTQARDVMRRAGLTETQVGVATLTAIVRCAFAGSLQSLWFCVDVCNSALAPLSGLHHRHASAGAALASACLCAVSDAGADRRPRPAGPPGPAHGPEERRVSGAGRVPPGARRVKEVRGGGGGVMCRTMGDAARAGLRLASSRCCRQPIRAISLGLHGLFMSAALGVGVAVTALRGSVAL